MPDPLRMSALTEAQLEAWGHAIGRGAARPLVLALSGPLGAGKSVLARAIARGAGVEGRLPSPTFNLVYRYDLPDGGFLHHLDLYRLNDADEVWELGWSEMGVDDQIMLIEWPERAESLLPTPRWDVRLSFGGDDALRDVSAVPVGDDAPALPAPGEVAAAAGAEEAGR